MADVNDIAVLSCDQCSTPWVTVKCTVVIVCFVLGIVTCLPNMQGTIEAAKNLDVVLGGLRENSAEGVDYFQVLADVFSNVWALVQC